MQLISAVILTVLIIPHVLFHEFGHVLGCLAHGDRWLSTHFVGLHHNANCSNPNSAIFLAGGTSLAVAVWVIFTIIFQKWLLPRTTPRCFWFVAWFWLQWTFWSLGELILWALQAREQPPIDDSPRFIAATHIHPQLVITGATLLALLLARTAVWPVLRTIWQRRHE
jgi:hypothetical protein